jgi:hypothetical protein
MSLRISSSRDDYESAATRRGGPSFDHLGSGKADGGDSYLSRLLKLIPGEAVAIFPFLNSRADQLSIALGNSVWPKYLVAWLVLAMIIVLRAQATRGPNGMPQWGAVLIAAVSFMLWVPVMHGELGMFDALGQYLTVFGNSQTFSQPAVQTIASDPAAVEAARKAAAAIKQAQDVRGFVVETLLMLWTIIVPLVYQPRQ